MLLYSCLLYRPEGEILNGTLTSAPLALDPSEEYEPQISLLLDSVEAYVRDRKWESAFLFLGHIVRLDDIHPRDKGLFHAYMAVALYHLGDTYGALRYAQYAHDQIPAGHFFHNKVVASAAAIQWEIMWQREHPSPTKLDQRKHRLLRWLRGYRIYV